MDIESMTLGELRQIAATVAKMGLAPETPARHPYEIGKCVIIRTVTMFQVGRLVEVHEHELVLEDAAWIADTGRLSEALSKGIVNECEPFPDGRVVVGRGAIVDVCEWKFPPLRAVK